MSTSDLSGAAVAGAMGTTVGAKLRAAELIWACQVVNGVYVGPLDDHYLPLLLHPDDRWASR